MRILACCAPVLLLAAACASAEASPDEGAERWKRREFQRSCMGTLFRIVVFELADSDGRRAREAAEAAFDRIAELDDRLSDYDASSELSRIGRASDAGAPTPFLDVSSDLYGLCAYAAALSESSDGAFDVTVGPLVRLWRRARRQARRPDPGRVREAAASVGYRKLELATERKAVRLHARAMRLDLGGLAKGFAVDEALRVLASRGFERALVDGGGDVRVSGAPPGETGAGGWRIALAAPGVLESPRTARLVNGAVATSGDAERYVELDGVRYSHLIDPRTGEALTTRRVVTVFAPTCLEADALASALSVLEPGGYARLLARYPAAAARVLVSANDEVEEWRSAGFERALFSETTRQSEAHSP